MNTEMNNNADIKVSVIMPIYNGGEYLHRAIADVLGQTLREIELICVDDGSTDGSLKIIKDFASRDERVKVLTGPNAGPSVARNKGIECAAGEFIIFLDADDFYDKRLVESLYKVASEHDLDIAVTRYDIYNESKDMFITPVDEPCAHIFSPGVVTSKNEHPEQILQSVSGYVWNKLYRRSFISDKLLRFDPDLYVFEDVYFVCTALSVAERVERIEDVLIHHRVYSDQSRARMFRKYYSQVPVVYKKIKEFLMQHGMYVPLSKSYTKLSSDRCFKIYNLVWADGKEKLWDMLHGGYAEEFGWLRHDKDVFDSPEVCEFVTNVILYTYQEYISRADQGKMIDIEQLDKEKLQKQIKSNENDRRFKYFFRFLKRKSK